MAVTNAHPSNRNVLNRIVVLKREKERKNMSWMTTKALKSNKEDEEELLKSNSALISQQQNITTGYTD